MARKLTEVQFKNLVYRYLEVKLWLPPGVDEVNWGTTPVSDLGVDRDSTPGTAGLQGGQIMLDLERRVKQIGGELGKIVFPTTGTLGGFALKLYTEQKGVD